MASDLTPKKLAFCREYIVDLNATQAAVRAGYSERTARVQSQRLLAEPAVDAEVKRLMDERAKRAELSGDRVIGELMKIAFMDIGEAFNPDGSLKRIEDIPESARRAISGLDIFEEFAGRGEGREQIGWTKKVRLNDKIRALELLGKHLRMFSDKLEVTGKDGGPIQTASALPSAQAVAEFSSGILKGYQEYRDDESGEAAVTDEHLFDVLSQMVAEFASGSEIGEPGPRDPVETGGLLAMCWFARKRVKAPASFQGQTNDDP